MVAAAHTGPMFCKKRMSCILALELSLFWGRAVHGWLETNASMIVDFVYCREGWEEEDAAPQSLWLEHSNQNTNYNISVSPERTAFAPRLDRCTEPKQTPGNALQLVPLGYRLDHGCLMSSQTARRRVTCPPPKIMWVRQKHRVHSHKGKCSSLTQIGASLQRLSVQLCRCCLCHAELRPSNIACTFPPIHAPIQGMYTLTCEPAGAVAPGVARQ
eukprot:CAMPEP_0174334262 /NCGR_PEP_ID=MMETSP0810-20121108/19795_1 /TAXON_ID=73025 ORGANISM="Eutreptiella gymnastica-like, Strain CCMP1594" /NCGR_SAMPLE_ID=MMETSP0810 /ASSEMBLY_ACC=CAM_ASM_000659 /LENGTH=214 /DNA_ID=CAMNT_0015451841 /DNA_START=253 /DNA_END=897 /DNA_ORIENTATION=+